MRKRKRKTLKYMRLSLLCFGLHACSLFLEPFAINGENEMTTAGYALGGIFWASFLAGKHPGGASSGGSGCYGIHFLSAHDGKWQSLQIYDTK